MLSSAIQSGINSPASKATENMLFPAPAETTTLDSAVGNSPAAEASPACLAKIAKIALEPGLVGETNSELFAGQLSDALASAEQSLPEVTSEQTAIPTPEQPEPNAEAWLLAMLDQQQLQLQARDTLVPVPVGVTTATPLPVAAVALADTQQPVSVAAVEKFPAVKNLSPLAPEIFLPEGQINSGGDTNVTLSDKAVELPGKTIANPSVTVATANAVPATDASVADNSNAAALTNAMSSAANNSSTSVAPLTTAIATTEISNSPLIAPTVLGGTGADSVQRSVQSHLGLQAPEAKWGEQLLHALRDNVQVQIQQKIQNATIRLDPPELGSLEIYLSHEAGRLNVHITASQADVARLIQHTSDRLRHELAGPQFTQVNVQTSAEGQGGQQQSRERQRLLTDELILANEQPVVSDPQANRPGDVLVTV